MGRGIQQIRHGVGLNLFFNVFLCFKWGLQDFILIYARSGVVDGVTCAAFNLEIKHHEKIAQH